MRSERAMECGRSWAYSARSRFMAHSTSFSSPTTGSIRSESFLSASGLCSPSSEAPSVNQPLSGLEPSSGLLAQTAASSMAPMPTFVLDAEHRWRLKTQARTAHAAIVAPQCHRWAGSASRAGVGWLQRFEEESDGGSGVQPASRFDSNFDSNADGRRQQADGRKRTIGQNSYLLRTFADGLGRVEST